MPTGRYRSLRGRAYFAPVSFLVLGLALGLAGCRSGGSSSAGASAAPPPIEISQLRVTPHSGGTVIEFLVISPDNDSVDLAVEYSEDRGATYRSATLIETAGLTSQPATESGTPFQATWLPTADVANLDQADFRLRVTPTNAETGAVGESSETNVFALGDNALPIIHSVVTPAGTQGGKVALDYDVSDLNEDHIGISLQVSTDGGTTWNPGTTTDDADGASAVPTSAAPVTRTVVWNAQADLPATTTSAMVKVIPVDVLAGAAAQTGAITLNLRAPTLLLLSVGRIPDHMNGSESYLSDSGTTVSFGVSIPPHGYRVTVDYVAAIGGGVIDPTLLSVSADRDLGAFPAGTNLAANFTADASNAYWDVPSTAALSTGHVTFTASIGDQFGNRSQEKSYTAKIVSADGLYRPFEITDLWYLDFQTDLFTTTFSGGATVSISTTNAANGIPDWLEDLKIVGLQTDNPTAACAALGTNAILASLTKSETLGRLNELYGRDFDGSGDGYHANLRFTLTPGGARSSIRIGGDDVNPGYTLGRAQYDYRNVNGNADVSNNLGVFFTNMIQFYVNSSFTFRNRFDPLIAGRGTPAGEDPLDHIVLDPSFDRLDPGNTAAENTRYDRIYNAIDALARSVAVVAAHEIGHSIGLCANGVPPAGLFGGVNDAPFAGTYTTDYHFDSSGNNIMAAALSFSTSLITGPAGYRFNELNEAYLREWIILQE